MFAGMNSVVYLKCSKYTTNFEYKFSLQLLISCWSSFGFSVCSSLMFLCFVEMCFHLKGDGLVQVDYEVIGMKDCVVYMGGLEEVLTIQSYVRGKIGQDLY